MKVIFSYPKKPRLCTSYPLLYKELVRAYLYDWHERVDNLVRDAVENTGLTPTNAEWLMGMAQDFVATYRFVDIQSFTLSDDHQLNTTATLPNSDSQCEELVIPTLHEVVAVE